MGQCPTFALPSHMLHFSLLKVKLTDPGTTLLALLFIETMIVFQSVI